MYIFIFCKWNKRDRKTHRVSVSPSADGQLPSGACPTKLSAWVLTALGPKGCSRTLSGDGYVPRAKETSPWVMIMAPSTLTVLV